MKKSNSYFYGILSILLIPFYSLSQENATHVSGLLTKYYVIKDALVNSNPATAANGAIDFVSIVKAVDTKGLAADEQKVFKSLQSKLITSGKAISDNKELAKQRIAFQAFSESMIALSKATKTSKSSYIAYCPMKNAYWLSAEQGIKNPYYGSTMLTCGKVTETLK
ncbi:MAG TPA: DUF3347 domain-containing protein [Segetibacter sp.]